MIFLCTDNPTFNVEGDSIRLTIPSGGGEVEIALTRNQLGYLMTRSRTAMVESFDQPEPTAAEVVPMKKPARKRRRA